MASESEPLAGTARRLVEALLDLGRPVSGRRVATALKVSPTTAASLLKGLEAAGIVDSRPAGRASLWTVREDAPEVLALIRPGRADSLPSLATGDGAADADLWQAGRSAAAGRSALVAVVFTALPLEYAAVRAHLTDFSKVKTRTGTRFEVGILAGTHIDWRVHLAEIGMGNAGAAAEVATAVEAFDPALLLFVGVGAGVKPADQARGDVVIAERVYNVHSGKHVPGPGGTTQILARPVSMPTLHRLTQLVRAVARSDWSEGCRSDGVGDAAPRAFLKPIAAVEAVLTDLDDDLVRRIANQYNDAAAVDMESYGVYEAAHRLDTPALAVRGLSDLVGGKDAEEDLEWQPVAAASAAAFAAALLRFAEGDDLPPGGGRPAPNAPTAGEITRPAVSHNAEARLASLAPSLRPWWRRLRNASAEAAVAALEDLTRASPNPATWLRQTLRRPPAWLRDDATGDAWALLARFADGHGASQAADAYDRAAGLATRAGMDTVGGLHRLAAALSVARHPGSSSSFEGDSPVARALQRLASEQDRSVEPVTALLRAGLGDDRDAALAAAAPALDALGVDPVSAGLISSKGADAYGVSRTALADLAVTDPDVVDELRGEVLLLVATLHLMDDHSAAALQAIESARRAIPEASGPLLFRARAQMQRVAGPSSSKTRVEDTTALLADIEQTALLARDRRQDWNGPTGEALALAGRARAQAGDPAGALRILLSAPRGRASDQEAADPAVREIATLAATMAGEPLLAAELASGVEDRVERHLLRAMALNQQPGMSDEVERSYRLALQEVTDERPDQLVRALLGLARLGAPIDAAQPDSIAPELARLSGLDAEAADLVTASAALRSGRARDALLLARQYPTSQAAVQIAAEAASLDGRPDEAVRVLERAGHQRGDDSLLVQAMLLAMESGLDDAAERLADRLVTSARSETQRHALRVKLELAGRAGRWQDVSDLAGRLIDDVDNDETDATWTSGGVSYRWALAGAEYNLRRPERAVQALQSPEPLAPRNRMEALLLVASLQAAQVSATAQSMTPLQVFERVLAVAADWASDEEVTAAALSLIMTTAPNEEMPDPLLARVRGLQEEFFTRFPDTKLLRRIDIGEDFAGLIQHLRDTLAPGAEMVRDVARRVWLGYYPQAVLADVTGRSYAEALIKRVVGCHIIAGDVQATEVAATARGSGTVAVDTSVLIMIEATGLGSTRLTAQFERLVIPSSLRDDVLQARGALSMRGTGSLGWDPVEQRPTLTDFPPEVADGWAITATQLADRLTLVDVVPNAVGQSGRTWDSALLLAKELSAPLWADDVALRQAARSEGVSTFGTVDLLQMLLEEGSLSKVQYEEALHALADAYAVDLPLLDELLAFARSADWQPTDYAALMLSRPRTWSAPAQGFARYATLMRSLPTPVDPATIAGWAEAACTGLAWASPPPARPRVIGALLAWTALNTNAEMTLRLLVEVGDRVQTASCPDGRVLAQLVTVLGETIRGVAGASETAATMMRLLGTLEGEAHTEAMHVFLADPPQADRS